MTDSTTFLRQHTVALGSTLILLLVGAFGLIALLFVQLHETREDLDRVESGTAFFASQVQTLGTSLTELEPELVRTLNEAIAGLEEFRASTIEIPIQLEQSVPIANELEISRDLTVPVQTSIPISESLETTIQVEGPLGFAVPVDVTVPIELEVPVDLLLTVPIDELIPIETNLPLQMDLPVTLEVAETELALLIDSLTEALAGVLEVLRSLTDR